MGAQVGAAPLLVSAAASLTDVLVSLKTAGEAATGMPLQFNFGGSGTLRRQIEEGAPADIFFSAAVEDMDKLDTKGLTLKGSRIEMLSNSIALVGDASAPAPPTMDDLKRILAGAKILAIGNPDSVPAGRYAMQALTSLGLKPLVDGRLAYGGSVREVLQYVYSGSAPLGIVFLTDAYSPGTAGKIKVLYRFPDSSLSVPVLYPAAIVAGSANEKAARAYLRFLQSPLAAEAFRKAGFTIP